MPLGEGGSTDYSQWKFTLAPNYTSLKEGQNKITSRVMCPGNGSELTKWFGINVTGVSGTSAQAVNSSSTSQRNDSAQPSGPVYSYSQHKSTSKDPSRVEGGQTQDQANQIQQKEKSAITKDQTQTTQTTPSNNQTGQPTGFIPPFSTP